MKPRRRPRRLARLWRDLRSWGDPVSRDLSTAGELLVAKARVAVVLLLLLIPVKSVVVEPALADNWIGLGSALLGLAFATLFLRLARRVGCRVGRRSGLAGLVGLVVGLVDEVVVVE